MLKEHGDAPTEVDPRDAAGSAGLRYVTGDEPGISRRKAGRGFSYRNAAGCPVKDPHTLKRIRSLAIPPAWTDVWICAQPNGHIQATGRDARGRKQYRYHDRFRDIRESAKFDHLVDFAYALPKIRTAVRKHMSLPGLPREKVVAATVQLLDSTLIRVGNEEYARGNKSYGLTTLRDPHVAVNGSELRFQFRGKGGKIWRLRLHDRRIAKIVKSCQELPGQKLLQYVDGSGLQKEVTSADVNDYLKEVSGSDITAKDFRTWAGTVLATMALQEFEAFDTAARAKKNLRSAIEKVASRLGNTPTICRKCYIHPEIFDCYLSKTLSTEIVRKIRSQLTEELPELSPEEAAVLTLLAKRVGKAAA